MGERDVKRKTGGVSYPGVGELPEYLAAFEELKNADEARTIELIGKHRFTHEMVNTKHKNSAAVWEALLQEMPATALLRNLGKMSEVGLLKPLAAVNKLVTDKLADQEKLVKARVHPIAVLTAIRIYKQGKGDKGSLMWTPVPQIVDALDAAFYLAFGSVPKTDKSFMLALDVSGSMGSPCSGVPGLSCREASAVMAMMAARCNPNYMFAGFGHQFRTLDITSSMRLDTVVQNISNIPFGSTDCALPMVAAGHNNWDVDVFQVYTDSETYYGNVHPFKALKDYRQKSGRNAKLVVCAMTATPFTIADPSDAGMLDCVGLDSSAPTVIADFAAE